MGLQHLRGAPGASSVRALARAHGGGGCRTLLVSVVAPCGVREGDSREGLWSSLITTTRHPNSPRRRHHHSGADPVLSGSYMGRSDNTCMRARSVSPSAPRLRLSARLRYLSSGDLECTRLANVQLCSAEGGWGGSPTAKCCPTSAVRRHRATTTTPPPRS